MATTQRIKQRAAANAGGGTGTDIGGGVGNGGTLKQRRKRDRQRAAVARDVGTGLTLRGGNGVPFLMGSSLTNVMHRHNVNPATVDAILNDLQTIPAWRGICGTAK